MQDDLHFCAHMPQLLHLDASMRMRKREKRLKRPKIVPTGQIVLHHVRPERHARIPITASEPSARQKLPTESIAWEYAMREKLRLPSVTRHELLIKM